MNKVSQNNNSNIEFDVVNKKFQDLSDLQKKTVEIFPKKIGPSEEEKKIDQEIKIQKKEMKESHKEVESKIEKFKNALHNKTSETFQELKNQTALVLQKEKQECIDALAKLNGTFYEDPFSQLKQAWDLLVETLFSLFHIEIKTREEINGLSLPGATGVIQNYLGLEKTRDQIEKSLQKIISIEKASDGNHSIEDDLREEKNRLLRRKEELCGSYCNGLLDTAWKNYKNASQETSAALLKRTSG